MRRWIAVIAVAGAAALLMSGCSSLPKNIDTTIADDWSDPKEPTGWTPATDKCQAAAFTETVYLNSYAPISCTEQHQSETIHVGTFDASLRNHPERNSPPLIEAYKACDAKAVAFLGGHWQDGKLWLGVSLPSSEAWIGGARWYRCEVVQLDDVWGDAIGRSTSLKDALKLDATVKIGCQTYKSGVGTTPVACSAKHNAEFVGNYFGAGSYAKLKNKDAMAAGCRGVIAKFVGLKNDSNMKYRTGVIWDYPSQAEWNAGDHGVRCFLWLGTKTVTKSLKGTGAKGLPINYV